MSRGKVNLALFVLLLAMAVVTWGLQREPTQPNSLFLPEMYYSVPSDPQAATTFFEDGSAARVPVKGTIPRGFLPLPYKATDADAIRAGNELRNPFSNHSGRDAERGTEVFRTFCQPCHGASGAGDGTVTRYGFPPPTSLASPAIQTQRDGQIFHTISLGKRNMPSLASQISRDDRWRAILHVRSLQATAMKQQASAPKQQTATQTQ